MNLKKISLEQILDEVQKQISSHGEDHVDLMVEHEKKIAYVMFHSRHNSFCLAGDFDLKEIDIKSLIDKAEKLGYAVCEEE